MKTGITMVLFALICVSVLSCEKSHEHDRIVARDIVLEDDWGNKRMRMYVDEKGIARLDIFDKNNRRLVHLGAEKGGSLILEHRNAPGLIVLGATKDGQILSMVDETGRAGLGLGHYPDGATELTMSGPDLKRRAVLSIKPGGTSALAFSYGGEIRAGLAVKGNGSPFVSLYGRGERRLFRAP